MVAAQLARLEAESSVRRLVALYCDAVNRLDAADAQALFAADAAIRIADGPEISGSAAIGDGMRKSFAAFDLLRMQCDSGLIDVSEDARSAKARHLVFEVTHKPGEAQIGLLWGDYEDTYACYPEGWRFQQRHYTMHTRVLVDAAKLQQTPL